MVYDEMFILKLKWHCRKARFKAPFLFVGFSCYLFLGNTYCALALTPTVLSKKSITWMEQQFDHQNHLTPPPHTEPSPRLASPTISVAEQNASAPRRRGRFFREKIAAIPPQITRETDADTTAAKEGRTSPQCELRE